MPRTTYPRAVTTGLVSGQTAEAQDVLNAITPLDKAVEDLRIGWLEFAQVRFDPTAATLTVTAGAITISNSSHSIQSASLQVLSTINGANTGDIIYLERAGSFDIIVGDYLLTSGTGAWIVKKASGFNVIASNGSPIRCAFRAYRTGGQQVIATATLTKVQFNATAYNQIGPAGTAVYDPTTNYRYTPGRSGIYQFDISVIWASAMTAGGLVLLYLVKNGSTIIQVNNFGTGGTDLTCLLSVQDQAVSPSDYYEVFVSHTNGANRNIYDIAAQVYFSAIRVGDYI